MYFRYLPIISSKVPDNKILLVEDDEDDKTMFLAGLREVLPAVHCDVAPNYDVAISILHKKLPEKPNVIVMEWVLRHLTAERCMLQLKQTKEWRHIPIIIYTTSGASIIKQTAMELGAAGFIYKPYQIESYIKIIKEALLPFLTTDKN